MNFDNLMKTWPWGTNRRFLGKKKWRQITVNDNFSNQKPDSRENFRSAERHACPIENRESLLTMIQKIHSFINITLIL